MPAEMVFAVAIVGVVACVAIVFGRRLRAEAPGAALGVDVPPGDAEPSRGGPKQPSAKKWKKGPTKKK